MDLKELAKHEKALKEFARQVDTQYATALTECLNPKLKQMGLNEVTPAGVLQMFKKVNQFDRVEGEGRYNLELFKLACEELTHHHLTEEEILLTAEDYEKKIKDKYDEIKRKEWGID